MGYIYAESGTIRGKILKREAVMRLWMVLLFSAIVIAAATWTGSRQSDFRAGVEDWAFENWEKARDLADPESALGRGRFTLQVVAEEKLHSETWDRRAPNLAHIRLCLLAFDSGPLMILLDALKSVLLQLESDTSLVKWATGNESLGPRCTGGLSQPIPEDVQALRIAPSDWPHRGSVEAILRNLR